MRIFAFPEPQRTQRRRALAVAVMTLGVQGALASAHAAPPAAANVVDTSRRGDDGLGAGVGRYVPGELKLAPAKPGSPTAESPAYSPTAGATVAVRNSKFGKILVDGNGRTLYLFEADKATKSTCYQACAKAWPPMTTQGKPQAGNGASPALLGTTARTDHTTQVTYNGHPLYYYITDTKPGDITGQAVNSFGALWFVLDPKGNKIETR